MWIGGGWRGVCCEGEIVVVGWSNRCGRCQVKVNVCQGCFESVRVVDIWKVGKRILGPCKDIGTVLPNEDRRSIV